MRALFQVFQRDLSTTRLTWEYVLCFVFMYLSFIFGCAGYSWLCALFSSCSERGPRLTVVCTPLTAVASLVAGRGLEGTRAQEFATQGLGSCGSWALEHRLSSCGSRAWLLQGMWELPDPGIKLMSPALAGGFFTTEPEGKP